MSAKDESRYQDVLHRMHIATERNQSWWGLCPIRNKPRFDLDTRITTYEEERQRLNEARMHWRLMWWFSRQPRERTELPSWWGISDD
jgi:hypothetical protein